MWVRICLMKIISGQQPKCLVYIFTAKPSSRLFSSVLVLEFIVVTVQSLPYPNTNNFHLFRVLLEIGAYLKIEGNYFYNTLCKHYDKAENRYAQYIAYCKKVMDEYRNRNMESSSVAASALLNLVIGQICLGNSL